MTAHRTPKDRSLDVSLAVIYSVTCERCGAPTLNKYCSSACRQAGYRASAAHDACLTRQVARRLKRRQSWRNEKRRSMSMTFDARTSGTPTKSTASLGSRKLPLLSSEDNDFLTAAQIKRLKRGAK